MFTRLSPQYASAEGVLAHCVGSGMSLKTALSSSQTLLNALDADRDLFDAEVRVAQTSRNELLALVELYRR
jgi:hypothetical protein